MNRNVYLTTHGPDKCAGQACVIHNPSDHHMREWPLNWRDDTGVMERLCQHGVGHPDPDDAAHNRRIGREYLTVHGCCHENCCQPRCHDCRGPISQCTCHGPKTGQLEPVDSGFDASLTAGELNLLWQKKYAQAMDSWAEEATELRAEIAELKAARDEFRAMARKLVGALP